MGYRVLIVEDEVRLAATLRDLLDLNGYTADICHDGESGLDNALTELHRRQEIVRKLHDLELPLVLRVLKHRKEVRKIVFNTRNVHFVENNNMRIPIIITFVNGA